LIVAEAKVEARSLLTRADAQVRDQLHDIERRLELGRDTMEEIERRRTRFLKNFRQLLERELEDLEVEEGKEPIDQRPIDLELGRPKEFKGDRTAQEAEAAPERGEAPRPTEADENPQVDSTADEDAFTEEGYPSLDASVDTLADGYRGDAEKLFGGQGADSGTKPRDNLFSFVEDEPEEDPRWG
jgi:hypothetical protein